MNVDTVPPAPTTGELDTGLDISELVDPDLARTVGVGPERAHGRPADLVLIGPVDR